MAVKTHNSPDPFIYKAFMQEKITFANELVRQGVVNVDFAPPFKEKGMQFKVPYQKPLSDVGQATHIAAASTTVTPSVLDDYEIITPSMLIQDAIATSKLDTMLRGANSIEQVLGTEIGIWANRNVQTYWQVPQIQAMFDSSNGPLYSTHYYDYLALGGAGHVGHDAFFGTFDLFGENYQDIKYGIVNSKTFFDLLNIGVETAPEMTYTGEIVPGQFRKSFCGVKLIINDTLCAAETYGSDTVYPIYFCGENALYWGVGEDLNVETDRDPSTGGGTDKLYWSMHFGIAVNGVSWTAGTTNPTEANIATATNYTKKWEDKKIVLLKTQVKAVTR